MDHRTVNGLADELRHAFEHLALAADVRDEVVRPDGFGQLRIDLDDRSVTAAVTTRADLRAAQAKELPAVTAGELPGVEVGIVFGDRLSENTRTILAARGWGWLDRRRGHVRVWCPGLRLDALVAPTSAPSADVPRMRDPFTHKGIHLAFWLLVNPTEPASPRAISRQIPVSAGQVTNLLAALGHESLLRRDKTPLVPELFWALADHWRPKRHALAAMPSFDELISSPEMQTKQWVLTDTRAAMRYGAPVATGPDYPPDLYVPDQRALSWLLARSTVAPDFEKRVATVAIAPTELVGEARFRRRDPDEQWPLAHPVVVALDLARDRNRGREVVDQWQPDPTLEVTRVW